MEKEQKIVVVLLIMAILFSAISIIVSFSIANFDFSKYVGGTTTHIIKLGPPQQASIGFAIGAPPGGK